MANREIKFRAWDKSDKRMLSVIEPSEQGKREYYPFEVQIGFSHWNKEDIILMQWTGLKDKAGKEIYEGDLLREPAKDKWEEENYSCFEVFFHDGDANSDYNIGFTMCRMHNHGSICGGYVPSFKPKQVSKMIICGNIYEHPELLK